MKRNTNKCNILVFDIETAPTMSYHWGLFDQNIGINQIVRDGHVLCWAAKWVGKKKVMSDALINYKSAFRLTPTCDKNIAKSIWKLLDKADIVVTHNGDSFDIKWVNTLFLKHKLNPPSPFKSVDTKKGAKSNFRFISNKLDNITRELSLSRKLQHEGFSLWTKCMAGDRKAWDRMVKYCRQDVKILEDVYLEIRPYMKNHPNVNIYGDRDMVDKNSGACVACSSHNIERAGFRYTRTNKYQKYRCRDCGRHMTGGVGLIPLDTRRKMIKGV